MPVWHAESVHWRQGPVGGKQAGADTSGSNHRAGMAPAGQRIVPSILPVSVGGRRCRRKRLWSNC